MRYQIKEALEHISSVTTFHPNSLHVSRIEPDYVCIKCIDDSEKEHQFKYSNGNVFMWDNVEQDWVKVLDVHH